MVVRDAFRRRAFEDNRQRRAAKKAAKRSINKLMFRVAVVGVIAAVAGLLVQWLT